MINAMLRRIVRRRVSLETRQVYGNMRRRWDDALHRTHFSSTRGGDSWTAYAEVVQSVRPGELYENKIANLKLAIAAIDRSVIEPGARWSFWSRVGKPDADRGYTEGRTIVDGALVRQVGGGLCQLSGLLYHLALVGGLTVLERHAHSVDIYEEHQRYTPLGADATVVWGTRDLRLVNPHASSVGLGCRLEGLTLSAHLRSETPIAARDVFFERASESAETVQVRTLIDASELVTTEYLRRPGMRVR